MYVPLLQFAKSIFLEYYEYDSLTLFPLGYFEDLSPLGGGG